MSSLFHGEKSWSLQCKFEYDLHSLMQEIVFSISKKRYSETLNANSKSASSKDK